VAPWGCGAQTTKQKKEDKKTFAEIKSKTFDLD